jgi:hypothetical protein
VANRRAHFSVPEPKRLPQDIILALEEFVAMMAILDPGSEPANAVALPSKLVEPNPILPPI